MSKHDNPRISPQGSPVYYGADTLFDAVHTDSQKTLHPDRDTYGRIELRRRQSLVQDTSPRTLNLQETWQTHRRKIQPARPDQTPHPSQKRASLREGEMSHRCELRLIIIGKCGSVCIKDCVVIYDKETESPQPS